MYASALVTRAIGLAAVVRAVAAVLVVGLAVAGCAGAPVQETKQFSQAFTAVNAVGQPLLDDLAVAERAQGQHLAVVQAKAVARGVPSATENPTACAAPWSPFGQSGFIRGFCLADAGYFSGLSDPPKTLVLRRALLVIQQYADLLTSLADGTSAAAVTAQIQTLAQNASSLAALVPGAGTAAAALVPTVTALQPILAQAAQAASAAEERRLIRAGEPYVSKLIDSLRQAAPAMFKTLIEASATDLTAENAATTADLNRIEAYRTVVSDYVVLLGQLQAAWDKLVAASERGSSSADLATIVQISTQITANADAVRRSMVVLRRGGLPAN